MKTSRRNTIVWSAALAGVIVGLASPAAHGHGNNPRELQSSGSWYGLPAMPGIPTPHNSDLRQPPNDNADTVDAGEEILAPPDVAPFLDGDLGGLRDGSLQGLAIDATIQPAPIDIGPDLPSFTLPGAIETGGAFGTLPGNAGPIAAPFANRVPAPGTLALMGLAALAANRRRRRG